MAIQCPKFDNDRRRNPFDIRLISNIRRRAKEHQRILRQAAHAPRAERRQALFNILREEALSEWERLTANVVHLSPDQLPALKDKLVSLFGIHNRRLGLDPSTNYSVAGEVRANLIDAQQTIEGMIGVAGRIIATERLGPLVQQFNSIVRGLGIDRHTAEELFDDLITVGQIPRTSDSYIYYRRSILGRQTMVDVFQRRRYQDFIRRMIDAGFNRSQIDDLVFKATTVADSSNEVRAMAQAIGVEVGQQDNIGYFARQITPDFAARLKDLQAEELLEQLRVGATEFSTIHNRSRNTFHFIPEDMAMVAEVTGRTIDELTELMDDPLIWRRYLHENLTTQQLDFLVDSGIMAKLPMSSREVFEYFVRQYQMPYRHMSEAFILDPARVLGDYTQSLQRSAGNAAMLRQIADDGMRAGWAVPGQVVAEDSRYSNFVRLGDALDMWIRQAKIPGENRVAAVNQLAARMGVDTDFLTSLDNVYVHPIVADQWRTAMAMSMSPTLMNNAATVVFNIGKWFGKTALSTPQFITRTVLQNLVASVAAGANTVMFLPAHIDMFRLVSNGLRAFDDTRPFRTIGGETFTQRGLFELFLTKRGQNVVSANRLFRTDVTTNFNDIFNYFMQVPENVENAFRHLWTYTAAHGDPVRGRKINMSERIGRFSTRTLQMMNQLTDDVFAPFAFMSNFLDTAAKWALFQSITRNPAGDIPNILGRMGSNRFFDDVEDAFRYMDEYFVNPYKTGRATQTINNYVRPFATWAMANPPMQFRHMLRNPHLYLSYHRIRNLNQRELFSQEDVNEATVEGFVLDAYPMYVYNDDDGNPVVIMPGNYDPMSDTFAWAITGQAELQRVFAGHPVGTQEDRRKLARGQGEVIEDWLLGFFSQAHLPWKIAAEQLTGRTAFTGRQFTRDELDIRPNFLGVRMPPRLIQALSNIPFLALLDRTNPFDLFGEAPRYDSRGNLITPGELSIFGAERTVESSARVDAVNQNVVMKMLRLAGIQVRTIDLERNVRWTLDDIEDTAKTLARTINSSRITITKAQTGEITMSPEELTRLIEQRRERINAWFQLSYDHARVLDWARQRGVLPNDALRELQRLEIQVRQLPDPNIDTINLLTEEAMRLLDEQETSE